MSSTSNLLSDSLQNKLRQAFKISACLFLYLIAWALAVPFVFNYLKSTENYLRWSLTGLFLVSIAAISGSFSFWFTLIPVFCVELAIYIQKNSKNKNFNTWFKKLSVLSALILVHLLCLLLIDYFYGVPFYKEFGVWIEKINEYLVLESSQSMNAEDARRLAQERWNGIQKNFPAFYFGGFYLCFLSCFWHRQSAKGFRLPDYLFWLALLSFAVGFLDFTPFFEILQVKEEQSLFLSIKIYFSQLFYVLACLYFFQGFMILMYILEKLKFTRFWKNMWYILIIFNLPVGLVFVGLTDFLFEYRNRSFGEKK